jgi:hypothetical protein
VRHNESRFNGHITVNVVLNAIDYCAFTLAVTGAGPVNTGGMTPIGVGLGVGVESWSKSGQAAGYYRSNVRPFRLKLA